EDPVGVLERVRSADLHRLVAPEDRVRADPALTVVDDGALVVGPQQDEPAVQLEQVVLREPLDLAVGDALAVADHSPKVARSQDAHRVRHGANLPNGRAGDYGDDGRRGGGGEPPDELAGS